MGKKKFKKYLFFTITILVLILFVIIFYPSVFGKKNVFAGNLHTHTTCSDGKNNYDEVIEKAVRLGFKFIAITDHIVCEENLKKCLNEKRILCLPGQEVSTIDGHVLAIGIKKAIPESLFSNEIGWRGIQEQPIEELSIEDIVKEIHSQGGIAIAAHPTLKGFEIDESVIEKSNFDAIECDHKSYNFFQARKAKNISKKLDLPCVFDSDAHDKEFLKTMYNLCQLKELSIEGVKEAIKNGHCQKKELFWFLKFLNPEYWGIKVMRSTK